MECAVDAPVMMSDQGSGRRRTVACGGKAQQMGHDDGRLRAVPRFAASAPTACTVVKEKRKERRGVRDKERDKKGIAPSRRLAVDGSSGGGMEHEVHASLLAGRRHHDTPSSSPVTWRGLPAPTGRGWRRWQDKTRGSSIPARRHRR
uniref:Uncharacterized protein n=1 Tax=Oryza sativa subsp. japonica TaxID=39947 RepID=Q75LR1_ORYSJ|nr:hypothetical protein [Oryza sativa Japonica Group]